MFVHQSSGHHRWLLALLFGACLLALSGWPEPASAGLSVSCVTAHDCWSVGGGPALHWNGSRWSAVSYPLPAGTRQENGLNAVSCTARSNCWGVGSVYADDYGPVLNDAVRWNGHSWVSAETPNPAGTSDHYDRSSLEAVSCVSASSCWAVGTSRSADGPTLIEALRWNGSGWSTVPTPEPAGTTGLTQDYNAVPSDNDLHAISCLSRSDCWAVGTYEPSGDLTGANNGLSPASFNLALHWNGHGWSVSPTPQPAAAKPGDFNNLTGVWCVSRADCWAVGVTGFADNEEEGVRTSVNEIFHWSGNRWSAARAPQPGGTKPNGDNALTAITCASAKSCLAVGGYGASSAKNLVLRWDGTRWSKIRIPNRPTDYEQLGGVSCTSSTNCWATGNSQRREKLFDDNLLWNGAKWTRYRSSASP